MKTYLTYGAALAISTLLLTVVLFFLGFHSDASKLSLAQIIGSVGGLVITAICVVLGTKARRAEIPPSESFGYGRALGAGVMIVLVASVLGIFSHLLYTIVINPGMMDVAAQAQIEKWEAAGMSTAQIEQAEGMMRKFMHPAVGAAFAFLGGMFFGTIVSLITAAFLKRPFSSDVPPAAVA